MWFGGPHQALQGDLDEICAGNDSVIALAAKYPEVVPIATVHPYDGQAALDELERVAAAGVEFVQRRLSVVGMHGQAALDELERVAAATRSSGSEEHTSEIQSLLRPSYAVFC